MKKISILNIEAFTIDDLKEKARNKAMSEHIEFLMEILPYEDGSENYKRAIKKAELMHTPWFTGSYIFEYCKEEIKEEMRINDYLFDKEGNLLPITYYTKKDGTIEKITYRLSPVNEKEIDIIAV
jgi:5'-deoxynucleotidase YfbR-like HD superfamily hydrolase